MFRYRYRYTSFQNFDGVAFRFITGHTCASCDVHFSNGAIAGGGAEPMAALVHVGRQEELVRHRVESVHSRGSLSGRFTARNEHQPVARRGDCDAAAPECGAEARFDFPLPRLEIVAINRQHWVAEPAHLLVTEASTTDAEVLAYDSSGGVVARVGYIG